MLHPKPQHLFTHSRTDSGNGLPDSSASPPTSQNFLSPSSVSPAALFPSTISVSSPATPFFLETETSPITTGGKTLRACLPCQKSHLTCSGTQRPCNTCIKRSLSHLCTEGVKKTAKYLSTDFNDPITSPYQTISPILSSKKISGSNINVESKNIADDRLVQFLATAEYSILTGHMQLSPSSEHRFGFPPFLIAQSYLPSLLARQILPPLSHQFQLQSNEQTFMKMKSEIFRLFTMTATPQLMCRWTGQVECYSKELWYILPAHHPAHYATTQPTVSLTGQSKSPLPIDGKGDRIHSFPFASLFDIFDSADCCNLWCQMAQSFAVGVKHVSIEMSFKAPHISSSPTMAATLNNTPMATSVMAWATILTDECGLPVGFTAALMPILLDDIAL